MILFAKPGHERFSIGTFECHALHFTCCDKSLISVFDEILDVAYVDIMTKNLILGCFNKIDTNDLLSSYNNLFKMMTIIKELNSAKSLNGTVITENIIKIKEYIDSNFTGNVNIKNLSEIANLSPNHMRKKFRDCYGTTIQKYIIDLRLSYVQKLLVADSDSICEIAYKSGFNSQSHMAYMFKSMFGISPLEYRKNNKSDF